MRAYSISNSQSLRNCFVVSEGLSWLLFRPHCHPFPCFCLLGDRVGTGRGNQEVLSEQRQNRGNLRHAPQLQHFMSVPPGWQRGHLDISELLWRGPYGSHGKAPCRAAISIRSCFSCSEERGQREGRENAPDSLWRNSESQKDVLSKMSDNLSETLRSAVSCRLLFRTDCNVTLISHSAYRVRADT